MQDMEIKITSALNQFCFDNIWNEVVSEARENVQPFMLNDRSVTGRFRSFDDTYLVPPDNSNPYFVYVLGSEHANALLNVNMPSETWISTDVICNQYNVLMNVYHLSGKMFSKSCVYIYWSKDRDMLYMAILKKMAVKVVPFNEMKNVFITFYYDSDRVNEITVFSKLIPKVDDRYIARDEAYQFYLSCEHRANCMSVYVDGYEVVPNDIGKFTLGSYVDIVHDANIIIGFNVGITNVENDYAFYSDEDKVYKQLVHIPKRLNPDNKVITHNTCDIYVRNSSGKGLYLHRCADRSVTQVTHNDFAVPTYILDDYRDYLQDQNISLHVVCRQHDKNNVLIRDKSYIDLLYSHDDTTILEFLSGKIHPELPFWRAVNLEKSMYVKMMMAINRNIKTDELWSYVEGLGYYHVLAMLCRRVLTATVTDWFADALNFKKPYLFENAAVFPVVYHNGNKVKWENVTYRNELDNTISIGISDDIYKQPGDTLAIEMFLDGDPFTHKFTPTLNDHVFRISFDNYVMYEQVSNAPISTKGIEKESLFAYKKFDEYPGNIINKVEPDGSVTITFGPLLYGRTFYIQNKEYTATFGKNIDWQIGMGNVLTLDVSSPVLEATENVPVFTDVYCGLYLNGKYLVPDVDFTVNEVRDYNGLLSFKQAIVQNLEYLKESGNVLEMILSGTSTDNATHGFLVGNRTHLEEVSLYFDHLSIFHADGKMESNVTPISNYLKVPNGKYREGAIFECRTSIPSLVKDYLSAHHSNDDLARIQIINEYFYGSGEDLPSTIVLPESHRIYSIYMASIVKDVCSGKLKLAYDPDTVRMLSQVASYSYLKEKDLVYNKVVDLRFIDVYPHYRQYVVDNPVTYKLLQSLMTLIMPSDKITSGEDVYVSS